MLYSILIICAATVGSASFASNLPIGSFARNSRSDEPALWAIRFGWLLLPFFDMDSPPVGGEAFDVLFGESVML